MNLTKKISALVISLAMHASSLAQLSSHPPPCSSDGMVRAGIGVNAGASHWDSPTGLGAFRMAGDGNVPLADLGMTFSSTIPSGLLAGRSRVDANGGSIRAIFLGESAGWLNSFGYAYDGNPAGRDSFTVFGGIQACPKTPYPVNVRFGDHIDVPFGVGTASNFDFWLDAAGDGGAAKSVAPGGVYNVFNPDGSSPAIPPGNVSYLEAPLMVNTWIPALSSYRNVATYVVGFEDSRADNPVDGDYSDLLIGFQFFIPTGMPDHLNVSAAASAVPEPAAYPVVAAIVLVGLFVNRRIARMRERKPQPGVSQF